MSVSQLLEVISENEADVTLTGGDPLMQIEPLLELAKGNKSLGTEHMAIHRLHI